MFESRHTKYTRKVRLSYKKPAEGYKNYYTVNKQLYT